MYKSFVSRLCWQHSLHVTEGNNCHIITEGLNSQAGFPVHNQKADSSECSALTQPGNPQRSPPVPHSFLSREQEPGVGVGWVSCCCSLGWSLHCPQLNQTGLLLDSGSHMERAPGCTRMASHLVRSFHGLQAVVTRPYLAIQVYLWGWLLGTRPVGSDWGSANK